MAQWRIGEVTQLFQCPNLGSFTTDECKARLFISVSSSCTFCSHSFKLVLISVTIIRGQAYNFMYQAPKTPNLPRLKINLLKPTGYWMQQQVEYFNNCKLCWCCIYVFYISLRTNSDLWHLHKKNWVLFIAEMENVYNAVGTGRLNEAVCAPSCKD
jgi:hypothetical protein